MTDHATVKPEPGKAPVLTCPNRLADDTICQSRQVLWVAGLKKFECEACHHLFSAVLESVLFLVDVQNLYCSVRDSYGVAARVDFRKLRDTALDDRKFRHIVSRAYLSARPDESPKGFVHALRKLSYDVKVTDIRHHDKGAPSGTDIDSQLVTDATTLVINGLPPSVVVIASGDSDFIPVYKNLKAKGCRVEVLAFTPSMSSHVIGLVDKFTELDRDFLFADAPISEHAIVNMQGVSGADKSA